MVKTKKIVTGLSERELTTPEGAGFDLRLGEVWEVKGQGFLGVEERETAKLKLIATFERSDLPKKDPSTNSGQVSPKRSDLLKKNPSTSSGQEIVSLRPGKYYVVKTVEDLNVPENIQVVFRPRSTLYRSGVALFSGNASPGYCGGINVGLINFGSKPFKIEMGARFIHAIFLEVKGKTHKYRGQWQGGRTQTKGKEKQV